MDFFDSWKEMNHDYEYNDFLKGSGSSGRNHSGGSGGGGGNSGCGCWIVAITVILLFISAIIERT